MARHERRAHRGLQWHGGDDENVHKAAIVAEVIVAMAMARFGKTMKWAGHGEGSSAKGYQAY